ncbi:MAG: hypothetical protein AABM67_18260 [Acidobacteriota bacterium]
MTRSFSPEASVQPPGVSPYVAPEAAESSFEESSDPFADAAKLDDDVVEAEEVTPERKPSRSKPPRLEATIEKTPVKSDQSPSAAPVANSRDTITALKPESPPDLAALRGRYNPPPADDSQAELQDAPLKSESPISPVKLMSSEKPSETEVLTPKELSTVVPDHRPLQKQRMEESWSDPAASADESLPREKIRVARRVAGSPAIVGHVTHREPLDAGVSTWHPIKKSEKASPLSPRTLPAHPTRPVPSAAEKLAPPAVLENVAPPITVALEKIQEVRPSFTALIPKVSTQSLLPVNLKSRPNLDSTHAPYETVAQVHPGETIINIAIGRIEVRATQRERSTGERQLKGPRVMDLDDYVRQRSRGNR